MRAIKPSQCNQAITVPGGSIGDVGRKGYSTVPLMASIQRCTACRYVPHAALSPCTPEYCPECWTPGRVPGRECKMDPRQGARQGVQESTCWCSTRCLLAWSLLLDRAGGSLGSLLNLSAGRLGRARALSRCLGLLQGHQSILARPLGLDESCREGLDLPLKAVSG